MTPPQSLALGETVNRRGVGVRGQSTGVALELAMTTAYFQPAACGGHALGSSHPECPQRLSAIADHLIATGLDLALDAREAPVLAADELQRALARAHSLAYVTEIGELMGAAARSGQRRAVDPDTAIAVSDTQLTLPTKREVESSVGPSSLKTKTHKLHK